MRLLVHSRDACSSLEVRAIPGATQFGNLRGNRAERHSVWIFALVLRHQRKDVNQSISRHGEGPRRTASSIQIATPAEHHERSPRYATTLNKGWIQRFNISDSRM